MRYPRLVWRSGRRGHSRSVGFACLAQPFVQIRQSGGFSSRMADNPLPIRAERTGRARRTIRVGPPAVKARRRCADRGKAAASRGFFGSGAMRKRAAICRRSRPAALPPRSSSHARAQTRAIVPLGRFGAGAYAPRQGIGGTRAARRRLAMLRLEIERTIAFARRRPGDAAAVGAARRRRPDRHQIGCGDRAVRRVHRPYRRGGDALLPEPGGTVEGRRITTIEACRATRATRCSAPGSTPGPAMRLLPVPA